MVAQRAAQAHAEDDRDTELEAEQEEEDKKRKETTQEREKEREEDNLKTGGRRVMQCRSRQACLRTYMLPVPLIL